MNALSERLRGWRGELWTEGGGELWTEGGGQLWSEGGGQLWTEGGGELWTEGGGEESCGQRDHFKIDPEEN